MCVRSSAGLHRTNLPRLAEVADIEYADTPETLVALRFRDSLEATVESSSGLLDECERNLVGN